MWPRFSVASPTTDEPITLDLADLSTSLNNGTGDFDEDDELVSELENALSVDAVSNQVTLCPLEFARAFFVRPRHPHFCQRQRLEWRM